jgi:hypothetical protein
METFSFRFYTKYLCGPFKYFFDFLLLIKIQAVGGSKAVAQRRA